MFDPEGWNTLSVEVRGGRIQVWLNGEEVGAVRVAMPAVGRIGLQLVGGNDHAGAEWAVREVLLRKLPKEKEQKHEQEKTKGGP